MHEILTKLEADSTFMFAAMIALVVLLVIFLTIVVSAMRVKTYKDRFWNIQVDNKEKAAYIAKIEKELQEYKIKDAKNNQELAHFSETKATLKTTEETVHMLQKNNNILEKELSQIEAKLESAEEVYKNLLEEHQLLKKRFDGIVEENAKYRVNNARLLMKLENEGRHIQNLREKEHTQGQNNA